MYLKKKLPFLFARKRKHNKNSVFVINQRVVVTEPTPQNLSRSIITECDKVKSLDMECEQIIQSYIETSKVCVGLSLLINEHEIFYRRFKLFIFQP